MFHLGRLTLLFMLTCFGLAELGNATELETLRKENMELRNKLSLLGFNTPNNYLSIPEDSVPYKANQPNGMHVSSLAKDVYFLTDSAYSSAIVDIGDSLVVIDAPPSYTKTRLLEVLASSTFNSKPVSHFIYTHAHADHVELANTFGKDKTVFIAHKKTAKLLKRNPALPSPTVLIHANNTQMTLGNKLFEFRYYLNSHVEGNLAIWLPNEKVFVFIDVVFPQWIPFYSLGVTQDPIRFFNMFDIILSYNFKYMVSGHLGRPATRADVSLAKSYLSDMKSYILDSFKMFNISDYYTKFGGSQATPNHWAVLHNWEGDMAFYCVEKLREKYSGVLAGVDVYSWSNCWIFREGLSLAGIGS